MKFLLLFFLCLFVTGCLESLEERSLSNTGSTGRNQKAANEKFNPSSPLCGCLASRCRISSPYGMREHPRKRMHVGVDMAAIKGFPVRAADAGFVTFSNKNGDYGEFIRISHAEGYITSYAHMSKRLVYAGQRVRKGDVIGEVGMSGYTTGNHLHFEIAKGNPKNRINPASMTELNMFAMCFPRSRENIPKDGPRGVR